jgi:ABC-type Zn uptake system ZnuABC Zn-binding protein ZnuA
MIKPIVLLIAVVLIGNASAEQLKIVTTTTALEDLVKDVGGDMVQVTSFVSSGVCPDHWDMKPSQFIALNESKIVFKHGMEGWLSNLTRPDQKVVVLSGPWNTPQMAINKTQATAKALIEVDPANAALYDENAKALETQFADMAEDLKQRAKEANTTEVKVICMDWQKGFISSMGFDIARIYGSEETLSIKDVNDIVKAGKQENISLVVDNLQSGTDVGGQIAEEIKAKHVILTNFPGAVPGTDSLLEMLKYNGEMLLAAI